MAFVKGAPPKRRKSRKCPICWHLPSQHWDNSATPDRVCCSVSRCQCKRALGTPTGELIVPNGD